VAGEPHDTCKDVSRDSLLDGTTIVMTHILIITCYKWLSNPRLNPEEVHEVGDSTLFHMFKKNIPFVLV
jgi:hypothetical protein